MTFLLTAAVRIYWALWPRHLNRGCIYRETCSHHVFRIAREDGGVAGLRALLVRIRTCRPGYSVSSDHTGIGLVTRDGSFIPAHRVACDVLMEIQVGVGRLEQELADGEATDIRVEPTRGGIWLRTTRSAR